VPPKYPLENIRDVPIALFAGTLDQVANPTDVVWLAEQLGKSVVFFKEYYYLGHFTFAIGKNMAYFNNDALNLFKEYSVYHSSNFTEEEIFPFPIPDEEENGRDPEIPSSDPS
jgi:hypothetical protein